jgi:Protein of unknown function (DUF2795)
MHESRDEKEEVKSVRGRSGQRRILGASVVWVVLGALAMLALLIMRRQATAEALKDFYRKARERLGQVRVQPTEIERRRVMNFIRRTTRRESAGIERRRRVMSFIRRTARTSSGREQEVRRYLKDVQYPATKDELVSAARSNDAPEELVEKLVGLTVREYSSPREVAVAVDSRRSTGA